MVRRAAAALPGPRRVLLARRAHHRAGDLDQVLERQRPALQVDQDRRSDHRPHLPILLTHLRTGTLAWSARRGPAGSPRAGSPWLGGRQVGRCEGQSPTCWAGAACSCRTFPRRACGARPAALRRHGKDPGPAAARYEPREGGEPGPVGWLVPHPPGVPAQHRVLWPEYHTAHRPNTRSWPRFPRSVPARSGQLPDVPLRTRRAEPSAGGLR